MGLNNDVSLRQPVQQAKLGQNNPSQQKPNLSQSKENNALKTIHNREQGPKNIGLAATSEIQDALARLPPAPGGVEDAQLVRSEEKIKIANEAWGAFGAFGGESLTAQTTENFNIVNGDTPLANQPGIDLGDGVVAINGLGNVEGTQIKPGAENELNLTEVNNPQESQLISQQLSGLIT